jgi:hypothetical protein
VVLVIARTVLLFTSICLASWVVIAVDTEADALHVRTYQCYQLALRGIFGKEGHLVDQPYYLRVTQQALCLINTIKA